MEERKIGKGERDETRHEMEGKERETKGIEENRSGEVGSEVRGEKVSAANITALMESLLDDSGGKTHTAVSQVSQVAPIGCQWLPWLPPLFCCYRAAFPPMSKCVSR